MINFCHIAPTPVLEKFTAYNGCHLLLAHLVEEDQQYRDFYANLKDGKPKILDNSAFEMFKQGRPMYDSSKLIEMGHACKADYIVMSDYPKEPWQKTVEAAVRMTPAIKGAGFKTFFVPQSELNDIDGVLKSYDWAIGNPDIDLIGVSILSCPIALGVNETKHADGKRDDAYKLQRFLSRWKIFLMLRRAGVLANKGAYKRFHCLGMTDGPNEIELLIESGFESYIYSWDSSAAVWLGMNGRTFDRSPSGSISGKFESEVDFNRLALSPHEYAAVMNNILYINKLCHM